MGHKLVKVLSIISIILLCCTLICGIWVGSHPVNDMTFHSVFSGVSVVVAIVTNIVNLVKCRFCNNHKK